MDESTSLENALDSIIEPAAEETEGNNQSEPVEEIIDDDGPDDEETGEYDDDIEYTSDEGEEIDLDDVEIDDEDPVEATEDTNLIPVKVDGKDEHWTLDQLKQSAAGQAAINKRFQEAAEVRKQLEQQHAVLQQQREQVVRLHQSYQQGNLQAPVPPTKEMFQDDPISYMEQKLEYDDAKSVYDNQMIQVQALERQNQEFQLNQHNVYLAEQAELLTKYIPDIVHPEKGQPLKDALVKTGVHYGWTEKEMQDVSDSRYVRVLNDARKWNQLVAKKEAAQAKGQKARPVVKPGAKKRQVGNNATRKKAQQRLQKTGSIDDALSLIINDS
jgi:hypothetical protein